MQRRRPLLLIIALFCSLSGGASAQTLAELTQIPNRNIQDVYESFAKVEDYYAQHGDRRKLFVKVYAFITTGIEDMISQKQVSHGIWLENMIVGFAEEYRKAVWAYETNQLEILPLPWLYDFTQAREAKLGLATQLLLSLNAHILYDLPRTIAASAPSSRDLRPFQEDYLKLNSMFKALTPQLFQILYQESEDRKDYSHMPSEVIKRHTVNELVTLIRKTAWQRALTLAEMKTPQSRAAYLKKIDSQTEQLGHLMASLDPFFSTKPGDLIPSNLRQNTLRVLKTIYELLGTPTREIEWKNHDPSDAGLWSIK